MQLVTYDALCIYKFIKREKNYETSPLQTYGEIHDMQNLN